MIPPPPPAMTFCEIPFGSEEFHAECRLRHEVLRAPLGLNLYAEDLSRENRERHFGLFDDGGVLVACVIAAPLFPNRMKIRQMAVAFAFQGKGCGRRMMCSLEDELAQRGIAHLSLHARVSAAGFYEKLGYVRTGPEFPEVGLAHILMGKNLPG